MIFKNVIPKIAFLALLLLIPLSCRDQDPQLQEMEAVQDSITGELKEQQRRSDSLQHLLSASGSTKDIPVYFGREFDTIQNPEEYINSALQQQREKIPIGAVLGGNMEFRQVEVLTENWVLAVYDDGHIQGKSIYEYELQPNGEIQFTELISKLPEQN